MLQRSSEGKHCYVVHIVMWHLFKLAKHCSEFCVCVSVRELYSETKSVKPACASLSI